MITYEGKKLIYVCDDDTSKQDTADCYYFKIVNGWNFVLFYVIKDKVATIQAFGAYGKNNDRVYLNYHGVEHCFGGLVVSEAIALIPRVQVYEDCLKGDSVALMIRRGYDI